MVKSTKIKIVVTGSILLVVGIAGLAFGTYTNVIVAPIIGALLTFAGFFMVVLGTRKEDEFGPAKPVVATAKAEVIKPATVVHEGYHGVLGGLQDIKHRA